MKQCVYSAQGFLVCPKQEAQAKVIEGFAQAAKQGPKPCFTAINPRTQYIIKDPRQLPNINNCQNCQALCEKTGTPNKDPCIIKCNCNICNRQVPCVASTSKVQKGQLLGANFYACAKPSQGLYQGDSVDQEMCGDCSR